MKTFDDIAAYISRQSGEIEKTLDLTGMTLEHGLHSFRFGSSGFLDELFLHAGLEEGKVFYDLGSGYGNVLFYGALKCPGVRFKGIEILPERNAVCEELIHETGLTNVTAIRGDILQTDLSDGDVFYLYNPLFEFQYGELFVQLKKIAASRPVTIIAESRCDVFDNADWLEHYRTTDIDIMRRIKYYRSR
jgi:hypothetical protein